GFFNVALSKRRTESAVSENPQLGCAALPPRGSVSGRWGGRGQEPRSLSGLLILDRTTRHKAVRYIVLPTPSPTIPPRVPRAAARSQGPDDGPFPAARGCPQAPPTSPPNIPGECPEATPNGSDQTTVRSFDIPPPERIAVGLKELLRQAHRNLGVGHQDSQFAFKRITDLRVFRRLHLGNQAIQASANGRVRDAVNIRQGLEGTRGQ